MVGEVKTEMESGDRESKNKRAWIYLLVFLAILIAGAGLTIFFKYGRGSPPLEISLPQASAATEMSVSIGGAVTDEGIYTLKRDSTLEELLQKAGALTSDADSSTLRVYVPYKNEVPQPQKVNINTAEAWLLDALPGIGKGRAQSIIDYRTQNGPFSSIEDITKVPGIGPATFDGIKDLITVAD